MNSAQPVVMRMYKLASWLIVLSMLISPLAVGAAPLPEEEARARQTTPAAPYVSPAQRAPFNAFANLTEAAGPDNPAIEAPLNVAAVEPVAPDGLDFTISGGSANSPTGEAPAAPQATRDLNVTVSLGSGNEAGPGNLFVYEIDYDNTGNSTASNVVITSAMSGDIAYVADWNSDGFTTVISGSTVVWTKPAVDANESGTLYVSVRVSQVVTPGNVLTNVAQIVTSDVDVNPADNVFTRTRTIDAANLDLEVNKGSWDNPEAGQAFTYYINFYNRGTVPAENVVITDTLPQSTTFDSWYGWLYNPDPIYIDLDHTITVQQAGNQLVWNLGNLEGGANGKIYFDVLLNALQPGDAFTNVVYIATTAVETDTQPNIYTHAATIPADEVDLKVSKTLNLSSFDPVPGNKITYLIRFDNNGGSDATNVIITDTLPQSATFVSWTGYTGNPYNGNLENTITPVISGNLVTWNMGTLLAGQYGYLYPDVKLSTILTAGDTLTNVVEISSAEADANESDNQDTDIRTVDAPERDLYIYKSSSLQAAPGTQMEYTIKFYNYGNITATNVIITDTLPATVTYASWSGYLDNPYPYRIDLDETVTPIFSGTQVIWQIGDMAVNASGRIYLQVDIPATTTVGTILTNKVEIYTPDEGGFWSNQDTDHTAVVTATEDLYIRKMLDSSPGVPGGMMEYEIYFSNQGNLPMPARITDTLPAGVSFVSWNSSNAADGASFIINGNQLIWDVGILQPGDTGRINLNVRLSKSLLIGDILTNTVYISIGNTETYTGDNDSEQITVVAQKTWDVFVGKYLYDYMGAPGGQVDYEIDFGNMGNSRADNVVITDTLPDNATLVSWRGDFNWPNNANIEDVIKPEISGNQIVWDLEYLDADEYGSIVVTLQIDNGANTGDVVTNVVEISTGSNDLNQSNNVFTSTEKVIDRLYNLYIYKYLTGGEGYPGGTMQYVISFNSYSNWAAANVVVTDTLPNNVSLVSWSGYMYNPDYVNLDQTITPTIVGKTIVWELGTLESDARGSIYLVVAITDTATVGDSIANQAEISTSNSETDLGDNLDVETSQVATHTRDVYIYKYLDSNFAGSPGESMWYRLYFRNSGNYTAANIVISDTLPALVDFGGEADWYGSMYSPDFVDLDDAINVVQNGSQLTWTLPLSQPLAPAGYGNIYVKVGVKTSAQVGQTLENKAGISTTDPETDYNDNDDIRTDQVMTYTRDLYLNKYLDSGTPAAGETIEYQLDYTNNGNYTATGVIITDTLLSGITYESSRDSNGVLTPTQNSNVVVWSLGTVGAEETKTIWVTVRLDGNLNFGDQIWNQADVSSDHEEANRRNNRHIDSTDVTTSTTPTWDVNIGKALDGGTLQPNEVITYRLSYKNQGNQAAGNARITDTLPANASFVSTSNSAGFSAIITGSVVVWTKSSLDVGESGELYLSARISGSASNGDKLVNRAEIGISETESDYSDNTATVTDTIAAQFVDLSVSKTGPSSVLAGAEIEYTLTAANNGNINSNNVVVTDVIPAGANYVSGGVNAGSVVTWTIPALAASDSAQVSFVVTATNTITNDTYQARDDAGNSAAGQNAVVTIVSAGSVILPGQDNVLTSTTGITVVIPAGAITQALTIVFTPLPGYGHNISTPTLKFAGHAFSINVYSGTTWLPNYQFQTPIKVTIHYTSQQIDSLDQNTLALYYWDEATVMWRDAANTCAPPSVNHDTNAMILEVSVCHLTDFATLAEAGTQSVYLPLVLK